MRRVLLLTIALWVPALAGYADESIEVDGRSVDVHVPASYSPSNPAAVVMLLHGFGGSGRQMERYMRFERLADEEGFLYLHPNGSRRRGRRYWAATDACCNLRPGSLADVKFLSAVLDEVGRKFSVDPSRIYLVGHSNGGFMSYRMACEHADRFAAIASLAGATWSNPRACRPSEPVHILQIHGTRDEIIRYPGGSLERGVRYPGAVATTETWATYNGCSITPNTSSPNLDLDARLAGDETVVARYTAGCSAGGSAELWTIVGGGHIPSLSSDFAREVVDYLLAHPKPGPPTVSMQAPVSPEPLSRGETP